MALIGLTGAFAIAFVAFCWATVKLARYAIKSDSNGPHAVLSRVVSAWKGFVVAVVLLELGPGIGLWLYDVYGVLSTVIVNA